MSGPARGLVLAMALAHFAAVHAAASCEPGNLGRLAGWAGVWIPEGKRVVIGPAPRNPSTADKATGLDALYAPWNDTGIRRYEEMRNLITNREVKGAGWGFPWMMDSFSPFSIVVSPAETVIVNEYREVRHVYTDGRSHAPDDERWATPWGDSVGCWKSGTLTIETISVQPSALIGWKLFLDTAKYVEKLRLAAPDRIESEMTVIDPVTLTEPWTVRINYVRSRQITRMAHSGDMFDNDRSELNGPAGTIAPSKAPAPPSAPDSAPAEVRLSTAELDRLVGGYAFESQGSTQTIQVWRRGERLWIGFPGDASLAVPLHAKDPLAFYGRLGAGGDVRFAVDSAGQVTGLEAMQGDVVMIMKRIAAAAH